MKIKIFNNTKLDDFKHSYILTSVEKLVKLHRDDKHVAFISAANALLFMDGGSDLGYMNAIPNIESFVKNCLKYIYYKSCNGRLHLPIGSAQLTIPENTYKFISSPSMLFPENITKTKNPYYCLRAALNVAYNYNKNCSEEEKITTIYTPFIGTGYGKFSYKDSYRLMREAAKHYKTEEFDFIKKNNVYYSVPKSKTIYDIVQEQPKTYANTEFGVTVDQVLKQVKKRNL